MDSALRPAGQPPVPLSVLVSGLGLTGDTGSRALVTGITLDSRAVEHGWLYVALPGTRAHGAEFAGSAVAAGAAAVLTDDEGRRILGPDPGAPVVAAEDARAAMNASWTGLQAERLDIATLGSKFTEDLWVEIYAMRELKYQKMMKRAKIVPRPFVKLARRTVTPPGLR